MAARRSSGGVVWGFGTEAQRNNPFLPLCARESIRKEASAFRETGGISAFQGCKRSFLILKLLGKLLKLLGKRRARFGRGKIVARRS